MNSVKCDSHVFPKHRLDGAYKCSVCGKPEAPPMMIVFDGDSRHAIECDCFDCRDGKTTKVSSKRVVLEYVIILFALMAGGLFLLFKFVG